MTNTQIPAQPEITPAIIDEWLVELANLAQENAELHERIAEQRAEIAALQRQLRRERMRAMQAAGAASLLHAVITGHPVQATQLNCGGVR